MNIKLISTTLKLASLFFLCYCITCIACSYSAPKETIETIDSLKVNNKMYVNGVIHIGDHGSNNNLEIIFDNNSCKVVLKSHNYPDTIFYLSTTETDSIISGLYNIYVDENPKIARKEKSDYIAETNLINYDIRLQIGNLDIEDAGIYGTYQYGFEVTYTESFKKIFDIIIKYKNLKKEIDADFVRSKIICELRAKALSGQTGGRFLQTTSNNKNYTDVRITYQRSTKDPFIHEVLVDSLGGFLLSYKPAYGIVKLSEIDQTTALRLIEELYKIYIKDSKSVNNNPRIEQDLKGMEFDVTISIDGEKIYDNIPFAIDEEQSSLNKYEYFKSVKAILKEINESKKIISQIELFT